MQDIIRPTRRLSSLGFGQSADPTRADEATDGSSRRTATLGQARRCYWTRIWRQQAAQARLRAARGNLEWRRYDRLTWRGAIEQPTAGCGGCSKDRLRLPSCGLSRPQLNG